MKDRFGKQNLPAVGLWTVLVVLQWWMPPPVRSQDPSQPQVAEGADRFLLPKIEYRGPEAFFSPPRMEDYVRQAERFLAQHPDSPRAPEVAADLLMVATTMRNSQLQNGTRARLLFEFPNSFGARYAVASFNEVKACREFFQQQLQTLNGDLSDKNCERLARALAIALDRWGADLVSDDEFALKWALVAHVAGHSALLRSCEARLTQSKTWVQQIAAIAFGEQSVEEKVVALHAIEDRKAARLFEQYFHNQLRDDQRRQPEMLQLAAERHLRAGEFSEALPLIEQALKAQPKPQLLYWRGWCLAVAGRADEAQSAFAELERDFPDDPWSVPARELTALVATADESLRVQSERIAAVLQRMRSDGLEQVEVQLELQWNEGRPLAVDMSLVAPRNRFEIHLTDSGKSLLAYRSAEGDSRTYIHGESSILAFQQQGGIPSFNVQLNRNPNGSYTLNSSWKLSGDLRGAAKSLDSLLDSPILSRRGGLAELLRYTLSHRGALPRPAVVQGDQTILAWVTPCIAEPKLQQVQCHIDPTEQRIVVQGGKLGRLELRHGAADSFPLSPIPWPDLPISQLEKMDASHLFRLFAVAADRFTTEETKR